MTATKTQIDQSAEVHCACGEWGGVRCEWSGPQSDTSVVELMPEHLRASHAAAGSSGQYPLNGAIRIRVQYACAERIVECEGGWAAVRS
jgi:hypothetical protein